jgi:replicative DNA helicase
MDSRLQISSGLDKIPPQAIDIEEAVLSSILIEPDAIYTVIGLIKPESFYKDGNKKIFEAAYNIFKRNCPVDLLTVTEELRRSNNLEAAGGPIYITQLTGKIVSTANLEYHARIVQQKYILRELIRLSSEIRARSFDESNDVAEIFDYAESSLLDISGMTEKKEAVRLNVIVDNVIGMIDKVQKHEIKLIGQPSGFTSIDSKTGGFKKGELVIIAGRPSMGKTALALQIALNNAALGYPVAFFSIEMSHYQIAQRCISNASGKTNVQLTEGHCNIDEINKQTEKFAEFNFYVDDSTGISVYEIHAKAKRMLLKYGIKLIIIDYLQLVHGDKKNGREQEVSSVSRGLKTIAKELDVPVIALSQLNRELEKTGSKKPQLSNLRESGAIEQDADVVWFIHCPAKYGERTVEIEGIEKSSEGIAEIIIAKNRNGIRGGFFLKHNESVTEFKDITQCVF